MPVSETAADTPVPQELINLPRLRPDHLEVPPATVPRFQYDRASLETGIVHLGVGAFHRAHMAVYTDFALTRAARTGSPGPWAITGVSLRSATTRDALSPQNGLYTVVSRDADGDLAWIVGAITGLMVAPEAPEELVALMAAPTTRIVSLTVTEKGYHHDPATGRLNENDPAILRDLARLDAPATAPGFIVAALARRRAAGLEPFTVLSCDNLPHNGDTVAGIVTRMAAMADPALARWVEERGAFPNTMVDRIVPATTDADRESISAKLGCEDAWPVITEPFSQWVVEDRFALGRPAWELEGVQMVEDVKPYELMKLRLLNGAHSTLAYLGYLAGYDTIAETMADSAFARLARNMMDEEVTPTLTIPPGADVEEYKDSLIIRFSNPELKHRTWQIAMDGSQKLPQRLLGTIRDRLAAGRSFDRLALGVAAWVRYVMGTDERGVRIDVRDPLAERLAIIGAKGGGARAESDPMALVAGFMAEESVFGTDLPRSRAVVATVADALGRLLRDGARATVAAYR